MNNTQTVRFSFTPMGKFFFGSGIGHKDTTLKDDSRKTSYIVRSRDFPQQTTFLGALRFLFWQLSNKKLEESPIGPNSFSLNGDLKGGLDFGAIQNISELYLFDGKDYYLPAPKDYFLEFSLGKEGSLRLDSYDPKIDRGGEWINLSDHKISRRGYFFQDCEQIGIDIKKSDEAFYKQSFIRMNNPKSAFVVFVQVSDSELNILSKQDSKDNKAFLSLGGDSSLFSVEWEQATPPDAELANLAYKNSAKVNGAARLILTSDAFGYNSLLESPCVFAITKGQEFRFINTSKTATQNYSSVNGKEGNASLSKRFQLFERGSVFYVLEEKVKAFSDKISSQTRFTQIGYNQFVIVSN